MSASESSSCSGFDFSDQDQEVKWTTARRYKLPFGKYKGRPLCDMIKTKKRRDVLKYYLSWDKLRKSTNDNIVCALARYNEMKKPRKKEILIYQ